MSGGICADFSRTCEGCEHVVTEERLKQKAVFRCFAPGRCKGYQIGRERFLPYIPAWCPKLIAEREQKLKGGRTSERN